MAFVKKIPEWKAPGSEPPETLKTNGFQVGYKPPAGYFNWFMHGASEALKELQGMKPGDIGAPTNEEMGKTLQDANAYADGLVTIKRKKGALVSCETIEGLSIGVVSHIEPVQEGSGDPSLDNVRPISGWNSVEANRTGKNLVENVLYGYVATNNIFAIDDASVSAVLSVVQGTSYVISCKSTLNRLMVAKTATRDLVNKTPLTNYHDYGSGASTFVADFTGIAVVYLKSSKDESVKDSLQIEIGTTPTDYEPYQGKTLTATLPETVYGGTLDWGTGVLTVDTALLTIDGSMALDYGVSSKDIGYVYISEPRAKDLCGVCCDRYPVWNTSYAPSFSAIRTTGNSFYLYDQRFESEQVAKDLLDAEKPQVAFKINAPYTIQLTPQQLSTLHGTNNVWSSTGETEATFNLTPIVGVTAEGIGAAPDGYGLGGNIQRVTTAEELDAFRVSGWKSFYNVSTPLQAGGTKIYTGVVRCDAYSESYCVQTIYSVGSGYILQRLCAYGEWGEWEWVNPILYDGTEYRTTERIDGKAVYKKMVSGAIQYRLDGETTWKPYGELIAGTGNTIHHTGNKPTGTYTGNGSSATRKIETGGIGNMLLVIGAWGYAALVFPEGCIYKEGTDLSAANDGIAYFRDGVLTIANTRENFNTNGETYTYYVL